MKLNFEMLVTRFFAGVQNPLAVSSFLLTVASGKRIKVDCLPTDTLPCALLLDCVSRATGDYIGQEPNALVDDFTILRDLIRQEYQRPIPGFWHPQGFLVSAIALNGDNGAAVVTDHRDMLYAFDLLAALRSKGAYQRLVEGGAL